MDLRLAPIHSTGSAIVKRSRANCQQASTCIKLLWLSEAVMGWKHTKGLNLVALFYSLIFLFIFGFISTSCWLWLDGQRMFESSFRWFVVIKCTFHILTTLRVISQSFHYNGPLHYRDICWFEVSMNHTDHFHMHTHFCSWCNAARYMWATV